MITLRRSAVVLASMVCWLGAGAPASANVVKVELTARHQLVTLMPGTRFDAWTFNGTVPGPVVRARLGDTLQITLHNADRMHGHSLDFHASEVDPMTVMARVPPGATRTFSFVPKRVGVFMYHCGTAPVLEHVGMGMYGMIIVDPPSPRPAAQEVMLVQSEFYGRVRDHVLRGGLKDMLAMRPTYMAFNGSPPRYVRAPIKVRAGKPVRIYLVDAGPSMGSAFHVVGEIFDTVAPDGGLEPLHTGSSTWYVPAGGAAIFELTFDQPGSYTFLTHELALASRGALGRFLVQ